jgi:hypothetical protein
VEKSEVLAGMLSEDGIPYQVRALALQPVVGRMNGGLSGGPFACWHGFWLARAARWWCFMLRRRLLRSSQTAACDLCCISELSYPLCLATNVCH